MTTASPAGASIRARLARVTELARAWTKCFEIDAVVDDACPKRRGDTESISFDGLGIRNEQRMPSHEWKQVTTEWTLAQEVA